MHQIRLDVLIARQRLGKLLTFRRFPAAEERLFLQAYADKTYPKARFGVVFGFFAWVGFCLWDCLLFPSALPTLAAIRLSGVAPLLAALAWVAVCRPSLFKAHLQAWLSAVPAAAALGLLLMMLSADADASKAFREYWPAFVPLSLYGYAFIGLRPLPAAALGWTMVGLVGLAGLWRGVAAADWQEALLQLTLANGLGMVVCARLDVQERAWFRLRQHHHRLARTARQERLNAQDARDEALLENARAEAALMLARQEREKLGLAIAEKERFLSAAYHDLQQPLSTIGLYARLARFKLAQGADGALGDLAVIGQSAQDIARMFQGARDIWEAGLAVPSLAAVEVCAIVDEILRELRECADCKGLNLRLRKPSGGCAWTHSDRLLLKRVLSNLVGNALKYTEAGGVLVGVVPFQGHIRIDVWDTGVGIAPEHWELIFDEYAQIGHPACGQQTGLGLGLAIVRRIVRNLPGHHLRLASRPGRGSRFSLSLPADATAHRDLAEAAAAPPHDQALNGQYVVIVEDELANLAGLAQAVREAGALAEGVDSVAAARRLFAERDRCPDILLTDFLLDGGDTGLDAVAALRGRFEWAEDVPVLFVTADLNINAKLAGFQGVYAIHRKPVDADALLAQMLGLLNRPPG
ncbi:MAG: ATP-binding protein [Candidatus Methylumidiphilus sp.]